MLPTVATPRSLPLAAAILCVVGLGVSMLGGASTAATVEHGTATPSAQVVDRTAPEARRVSANPAISARGRYVAFDSTAKLVRNDTNGAKDVYVRDRSTGTLQRVSVSSAGRQGASGSFTPAISGNGRFVAFASRARLVAGDTNRLMDVYVRDRSTRTTELVSVNTSEEVGNDSSYEPAISADGDVVAFTSDASNLAAGTTARHVYVRIRSTGVTRLVSVTSAGAGRPGWYAYGAAASANGRYVAFTWDHEIRGLRLMVRDRAAGTTRRIATASSLAAISADGRFVSFTRPISTGIGWDPAGEELGTPYDVFMRDRTRRTTRLVSVSDTERRGNSGSFDATMSAGGRMVAFTSIASNLVTGDTNHRADVFVRNRSTGRTLRVSVSSRERQGNGASRHAAVSANGRYVAFTSNASDLVARDPNGHGSDVFVRNLRSGRTQLVSARDKLPPDRLDPAALPRGANPGIVYLVRDEIRDGKLRVAAPTWGRHEALWKTAEGYVVRAHRGRLTRLVSVSQTGRKRVLTEAHSFVGTAVSPNGRLVAWDQDVDDQGMRQVVKIANPRTGKVLAQHRFRVTSVVAVNRAWVLLSQRRASGPRTFWWNYRKDAVSPVYDQPASGVDLRHDRIVFDLRTDGDFCNRVALLSEPSHTLWRSCRFYPHQWSPDGAHAVATATYFDAAGTYYWATIDGTTAARLGRVTGRLDWDAAWEDDEHFLTLAQSDEGKAAIIRCAVDGRCERASRLWNIPLPELSVYYAAPPVVLSSN